MLSVAVVGLGTMGAAMATRLVEAGCDVHVWNRSAGPSDMLVGRGASRLAEPADAFGCDVVLSMLSNDAAVEGVFTGRMLAGVAETGRTSIHVNMSTVSVACAARLAALHEQAGIAYVSAPVLGRADVAERGQLNIVAAGPVAAVDRIAPLLQLLGKQTWNVGTEPEKANLVKIGVNFNLIHTLQALAESVTLVERAVSTATPSSTFSPTPLHRLGLRGGTAGSSPTGATLPRASPWAWG